jgi:site-specific DNA recombinase
MHQQGGRRLPDYEFLDEGIRGARLDRPALDRLRDGAQRGDFDAVGVLAPDRLARDDAHHWFLSEECTTLHMQLLFLHNPFGDTPQGTRLPHRQGMIAEDERAQMRERTRRGRLEKARRGAYRPWAYRCYGYRDRPKRHGCAPHVVIEPVEADMVRRIYRLLVEAHLRCRQMTTRLNTSHTPPPSGHNQVWQPATVRTLLTNRVYAGQARDNDRQLVVPRSRQTAEVHLHSLTTGRRYRPETAWVWSDAPAMISDALVAKAQVP